MLDGAHFSDDVGVGEVFPLKWGQSEDWRPRLLAHTFLVKMRDTDTYFNVQWIIFRLANPFLCLLSLHYGIVLDNLSWRLKWNKGQDLKKRFSIWFPLCTLLVLVHCFWKKYYRASVLSYCHNLITIIILV